MKAALEDAATRLDACIEQVNNTTRISAETRQFLMPQALIYAAALSDYIANPSEAVDPQVTVVIEAVDQLCQLLDRELAA